MGKYCQKGLRSSVKEAKLKKWDLREMWLGGRVNIGRLVKIDCKRYLK